MNVYAAASVPRWATASISDASDSRLADLSDLGAHFSTCNGSKGRWFALRCAADAVHGFIAPRLMTTLFVAGVAIGIAVIVT